MDWKIRQKPVILKIHLFHAERNTKFNTVFWPSTLTLRKKSFEGILRGSNFSWKTQMYEACARVVDDTRPRALGFMTYKAPCHRLEAANAHYLLSRSSTNVTQWISCQYWRQNLISWYENLSHRSNESLGAFSNNIDAMAAFSNSGYLIQSSRPLRARH